jgi:xylulose-5-phosphate/fructose-6-phosphate phosphoketolase
MIYLKDTPLLREPLALDHVKTRLLGHCGSDPGQSFLYVHLNRLIKKYDLDVLFVSGPGHGAPSLLSNAYLEGVYSEGGEVGYSVSHAYGAAFDAPDRLVVVVAGDGEAETGPLATAWHSNKFLNPARDGAVLPVGDRPRPRSRHHPRSRP